MQVPDSELARFLEENGLGSHVTKLLEVMEADSVEDLKLVDAVLADQIIAAAGLKLVSAKKFRLAVARLRGEVQAETASPTAHVQADLANTEPASEKDPEEVVVLCIDRSGSMNSAFLEAAAWADAGDHVEPLRRTRMEAVKQMFYAFRDRTESTRRRHFLGLVQFDSVVETMLTPTGQLDTFERIVDDLKPRGQTAIYSAIVHAAGMLTSFSSTSTTLRVVALTDGQNNTGDLATNALAEMRRIGAVVDAIIVGDQPDKQLLRIVAATGGESWQVRDVTQGFELLEAESVVSLAARGGPRPVDKRALDEITAEAPVAPAAAKRQRAPAATVAKVVSVESATQVPVNGQGANNLKRVLKELQQVAKGETSVWFHSGEGVHIFPSEDLCVWRCLIEGPAKSPFEGGVFPLTVRLPANYPLAPPKIRFETPVYHCNISESGQPCLDILDHSWAPNLTVPKVLESLRVLLAQPDPGNALRAWVAEITLAYANTGGKDTRYVDAARAETALHSSKTVDEWKASWGV